MRTVQPTQPADSIIRTVLICLLWAVSVLGASLARAEPPQTAQTLTGSAPLPRLYGSSSTVNLDHQIEILEDPDDRYGINDLERPEVAAQFRPWNRPSEINLGFTSSTYWLRIPLQRSTKAPSEWLLEVSYAPVSELDFYAPGRAPVLTGSSRPVSSRGFFHGHFVFPVTIGPKPTTFYLRTRSSYALTLPIKLWQLDAFQRRNSEVQLVQFMYFGIYAALFIYNAFLFVTLRDRRFLYFSVYLLCFGTAMFAGNGYGRLFLWPDSPAFDELSQSLLLSTALVVLLALTRLFLDLRERLPRLGTVLRVQQWTSAGIALALLGSLVGNYPVDALNKLFVLHAIGACLVVLVASQTARLKGLKTSHYFLCAWCVMCCGGLVGALRAWGLLPTNILTAYALQIASVGEMLLLAMALADTVRRERDQREAQQALALQDNRQMLRMLRLSEERLEQAVRQRTAELEMALQQQQRTLSEYVRFGSLISHEFRNPLGVIESQLSLIDKERERGIDQQPHRLEVLRRATRRLTSLFETWLKSDRLDASLEDISLQPILVRDWTRKLLDEHAHITENHRLVVRLDPAFSSLEADEALLDIAVVNLLDNAAKFSPPGSTIELRTLRQDSWCGIAVSDQGPGIDAREQPLVFDAFYRSALGSTVRGMGLGLAMVRRIAHAHGGRVELTSAIGQGACFYLWLPVSPADHEHELPRPDTRTGD